MKQQHHQTAIDMFSRCAEQYRRRYVEGEIIPPGIAIVAGIGTHRSAARNLESKRDTGVTLDLAAVADLARDAVNAEWEKGVRLVDEEREKPESDVRGETVDKAVRLSKYHATELATRVDPLHVEREWVIDLPDRLDCQLAGTTDLETKDGQIRDLKTGAKSPPANAAEVSDQLTMYAIAHRVLGGLPGAEIRVGLDYLIDLKAGPKLVQLESTRTAGDFLVYLKRIETFLQCLQKGVFPPARRSDWWCSPRWCGYYETCPYVRGRTVG